MCDFDIYRPTSCIYCHDCVLIPKEQLHNSAICDDCFSVETDSVKYNRCTKREKKLCQHLMVSLYHQNWHPRDIVKYLVVLGFNYNEIMEILDELTNNKKL